MNTCGLAPLGISLKVMILSGLLLLCIGLPLALALSRPRWFGRRLLETLVSLPLVFPPIAIGFFVVAVAVVIFSVYNQSKINKREAANKAAMKAE